MKRAARHRCILCGSRQAPAAVAARLRDSDKHAVVRCPGCDHTQLFPMPDAADDRKFYNEDRQMRNLGVVPDLEGMRRRKAHDTASRMRLIKSEVKAGSSLLDVGCGYAFFVDEARRAGFRAEGLEVSSQRRALAREATPAPIHNLDLFTAGSRLGRYDAITAFHVIEHVSRPVPFLAAARKHLAKRGRLIIEVPNLDDLMVEASAPFRSFIWQRAHVSYFTPATLRRALRDAGFRSVEIRGVQRYGLGNMMNWMVSGKPQIESPDFGADGPLSWLEAQYKRRLERDLRSDALTAIARV